LRKFLNIWSGMRYAVVNDFSVGSKVVLSLATVAACLFFRQWIDVLVIIVASALMLVAELFNTALEDLCDYVQPEFSEPIGLIKDVSAAAVSVGTTVWVATLFVELLPVLWERFL
jgi:diacylglycerol kinase (ATP)